MKNLRIAFFGGSHVHFKISLRCNKLGARSYLLDKNKNCFASLSKDFINIDFNNIKKVIKFIKKEKINYLYTSQSDIGVLTLGYINSKFKFPGTSYELAKILTDKSKIRRILKKKNFHQPKFFLLSKNSKKKISFNNKSFLIKPLDSSGSRGIYEIKDNRNLKTKIKKSLKFSKKKQVILEEKIQGIEFGAQTFSINGSCKNVILHEDLMSKINSKIPVGHIFPFEIFHDLKEINKIKKIIKKAVDILGVKNGPCNVDCIFTGSKKLVILEISPRLGATCLPDMLKIFTDVDWDLNTIKLHNLLKVKKIKEKKGIHVFSKVFESKKTGYVKKIITGKHPKNSIVEFLIRKNKKISKFTDGTKLFGQIVAYSNNRNRLINNTLEFEKSIKVSFIK
jgi:biotin carboxylase